MRIMKNKQAKTDRMVLITLIIVVGIVVVVGLGYSLLNQGNPSNTISVTGESSIEVAPDLVSIYFLVETTGGSLEEASSMNSEIVDGVIVALLREGFNRDDMQTLNFNVRERSSWEQEHSSNKDDFVASHNIRVKFSASETSKIGSAIDAAVEAGAGVSYINFELSQEKQNEFKALATKQAAEDARIKAESLAEGLDKDLGKLVSVSDSSFDYYPWRVFGDEGVVASVAEAKDVATNIQQPSQQIIYSRVSVVYKIR